MKGYRLQVVGYSIIFFLLYTVHCTLYPVFASEDIGSSKISPASSFYFLKTIRENIEMKFAGTQRVKLIRQLEFATRRLREVKSLVGNKSEDLIVPTMERYWYHIQSLPDKNLQDQDFSTRITENLAIHLETLERVYNQLLNEHSSSSSKRAKMAIRATINRLVGRADLPRNARLPACIFLTKEASSSALNETERQILKERAGNCFKNLNFHTTLKVF